MEKLLQLHSRRRRERRWEDMNPDCLSNVFARVGMESLLLFVPFVCKAWYRATLHPICWERLVFPDNEEGAADPWSLDDKAINLPWSDHNRLVNPDFDFFIRKFAREFRIDWVKFTLPKFMKMLVNRGEGNLKFLKIPGMCTHYMNATEKILEHISIHCKGFVGLQVADATVGQAEAHAVAKLVPNLKYLSFRHSKIERSDVVMLLKECRELVLFDLRECVGFDEGDEEISELASRIPKFLCKGSKTRLQVIEIDDDNDEEELEEEEEAEAEE